MVTNHLLINKLVNDEEFLQSNIVISEIWQKNKSINYSGQLEERLYLGLSRIALIVDKVGSRQLLNIVKIAKEEKFKIYILKHLVTKQITNLYKFVEFIEIENVRDVGLLFCLKN